MSKVLLAPLLAVLFLATLVTLLTGARLSPSSGEAQQTRLPGSESARGVELQVAKGDAC